LLVVYIVKQLHRFASDIIIVITIIFPRITQLAYTSKRAQPSITQC